MSHESSTSAKLAGTQSSPCWLWLRLESGMTGIRNLLDRSNLETKFCLHLPFGWNLQISPIPSLAGISRLAVHNSHGQKPSICLPMISNHSVSHCKGECFHIDNGPILHTVDTPSASALCKTPTSQSILASLPSSNSLAGSPSILEPALVTPAGRLR